MGPQENFVNLDKLPQVEATGSTLQTALSIVFTIIGAVAVLVIVIAGLYYVLSQGDPTKTSRAKNAIIYAAVGLVIVVLAQVIVSFVLNI